MECFLLVGVKIEEKIIGLRMQSDGVEISIQEPFPTFPVNAITEKEAYLASA